MGKDRAVLPTAVGPTSTRNGSCIGETAFMHSVEGGAPAPLRYTLYTPKHPRGRRQTGTRSRTTRRLLIINHLAEFFPSLKKWHTLRWNLYGINSFGFAY